MLVSDTRKAVAPSIEPLSDPHSCLSLWECILGCSYKDKDCLRMRFTGCVLKQHVHMCPSTEFTVSAKRSLSCALFLGQQHHLIAHLEH